MTAILRAYVDETGDRGYGPKASPFFAFACVLIPDESEPALFATLARLRCDLDAPNPLHWNQHVKTFSRRQHVTRLLLDVPGLRMFFVLVDKASIPVGSPMHADQAVFYNYAAAVVVGRALRAAHGWTGGARRLTTRFGHVRGFDHTSTRDHLARAAREDAWLPWHALTSGTVHFDSPARRDGLQAADAYAGMLNAAVRPDRYGNHEPFHLLAMRPQLWRGADGPPVTVLGDDSRLTALPWWPGEGL